MTGDDTGARAATARIAAGYDAVPYNPNGVGSPGLDLQYLFGVAALYGDIRLRRDVSVLDLGCGGGGQILRAAAATSGRIAGIDISRAAVEEATARCAPLGPRCVIRQADLLDLDPETLGVFDVIYLVGVYYVVPPPAQARLIEILSRCLAPGGIAMISYYSPDIWRSIDALRRSIRDAIDMSAPPRTRIDAARRHVAELARTGRGGISMNVLDHAQRCDEPTFFHEMLGELLAPVTTAGLEELLAPAGIHFLSWMFPGPYVHHETPAARAAAADHMPGGYHYAVFAKAPGLGAGAWTHVAWETRLRRAGASSFGLAVFADPASGQALEVPSSATAGLMERLAAGPTPWPDLQAVLESGPAGTAYTASVKRDFLTLWQRGALTPVAAGAQ